MIYPPGVVDRIDGKWREIFAVLQPHLQDDDKQEVSRACVRVCVRVRVRVCVRACVRGIWMSHPEVPRFWHLFRKTR